MKLTRSLFLIAVLILTATSVLATTGPAPTLPRERGLQPSEQGFPGLRADGAPRADTTWFGQYEIVEGEAYALPFDNKVEGSWTFDRGTGPFGDPERLENGEGWRVIDITASPVEFFQVIDNTLDLGVGVPPPIIHGAKSLWIGADKAVADSLCWECGPGYGNDWCQRVTSEPIAYDGTGDVSIEFDYFSFTEPCYDGTQLYLRRSDSSELLLNPYPQGECANNTGYNGGWFQDSLGHYSTPAHDLFTVSAAEIGGAQQIRFVFEFTADGGWSDEDCEYATIWGPFGADDISITGPGITDRSYDFESGLQNWVPAACTGVGDFVDIVDVGAYTILDPCSCRLEGNILEAHAGAGDAGVHPLEQHVMMYSPICDIAGTLGAGLHTIFTELDMYGTDWGFDVPTTIREGWLYYPYVCEATGAVGWSGRIGRDAYRYYGEDPVCTTYQWGGTTVDAGVPIPSDAEQVILVLEVYVSCTAFAIDPCGSTNFTPILDNIAVGVTEGINAPLVGLDIGLTYQDVGSYPINLFNPRAPGPANCSYDLYMDTDPGTRPDVCADTLVVVGPVPSNDPNTRWEARLWWRVSHRAPLQADFENGFPTRYKVWRDRVADGLPIDRPYNPPFAWGKMDSAQAGPVAYRHKFAANFREDDDDFVGEGNPENEILWDDVFRPGTQIEYFVTSNYALTPNNFFHVPDTTGGFFFEFEVLPGLRTANVPNCGGSGFDYCIYQPATLYIDAYGAAGQFYVENALRTVLNGLDACIDEAGCEIPQDRNWDRYDYINPSSNYNAPFVRGSVAGSNNGMTLNQILGYRTILVNTGTQGSGGMEDEDFLLFDQWLVSPDCNANVGRQVFVMNGDKAGNLLELPGGQNIAGHGLAFMNNTLGATLYCESFNGFTADPDCGLENSSYCVRWLPVGGGAFPTETDVDAYGNYCPNLYGFNVYAVSGGTGNRYYSSEDGAKEMTFGQVVNEDLSAGANYRVVLDGVSWHHMTARVGAGGTGSEEWCPRDTPSIVDASLTEIGAALKWGHSVADYASVPKLASTEVMAACQGTWNLPADAADSPNLTVNRLYQNEPNPFNPRTTIRFSLAQEGPVELVIYDVAGRAVRSLVDEVRPAGHHSVLWDGTDDFGHPVGSGVYWSQMKCGRFLSNKKMVILK